MDQPLFGRSPSRACRYAWAQIIPSWQKGKSRIAEILTVEEEAFIRTLRRGGNILNQIIENAQRHGGKLISGDEAFKLKDTYGLPLEEILLLAKDSDIRVDRHKRYQALEAGSQRALAKHPKRVTQQMASESLFAEFAKAHGDNASSRI